jgi:enoyl-CoA hydratase/carnithine racemase
MTADDLVRYDVRDGVATLTLDAPPVNGYSHEMMRALDERILAARFDDAVHVLVLTGAGDKFFCAGADVSKLAAMTPSFKYHFCLHANETLLRLEHTPKLTIAALNGHCVGGGLGVALACDLRVARRAPGDRAAGGRTRRAAGHGGDATARAPARPRARARPDGDRGPSTSRRRSGSAS